MTKRYGYDMTLISHNSNEKSLRDLGLKDYNEEQKRIAIASIKARFKNKRQLDKLEPNDIRHDVWKDMLESVYQLNQYYSGYECLFEIIEEGNTTKYLQYAKTVHNPDIIFELMKKTFGKVNKVFTTDDVVNYGNKHINPLLKKKGIKTKTWDKRTVGAELRRCFTTESYRKQVDGERQTYYKIIKTSPVCHKLRK